MNRLENRKLKHRKYPEIEEETLLETKGNIRGNGEKHIGNCH